MNDNIILNNNLNDDSCINDIRSIKDFKSITFSEYKKTSVIKELLNSLNTSKIENACNWAAELICAGHLSDLWNTLLLFIGKNIHIGNPKLPIYIDTRFSKFKNILYNGYSDNELSMRNNEVIRKLFAEIICVLCLSKKKHSFEYIKIKSDKEFNITEIQSSLKAPNIQYASNFFLDEDPNELYIAINEFTYHISDDSKNAILACYWLEWIFDFEAMCKKKKIALTCTRRVFAPVDSKLQMDIVWIIWSILLKYSENISKISYKIMCSLLNIFSVKYTSNIKQKRRYLLYFAVSLITEQIDYNIDIIVDKKEIDIVMGKINIIYKQIKKTEQKPIMNYMFNGLEKQKQTTLDKTLNKLNIMDKLNNI